MAKEGCVTASQHVSPCSVFPPVAIGWCLAADYRHGDPEIKKTVNTLSSKTDLTERLDNLENSQAIGDISAWVLYIVGMDTIFRACHSHVTPCYCHVTPCHCHVKPCHSHVTSAIAM